MNRRAFLKLAAAVTAAGSIHPSKSSAQVAAASVAPHSAFDHYFTTLCEGFLRNARATSPSYAVCDYPQGTKLKGCCTPKGKTYVSVARMLPAMAEWVAARGTPVAGVDLRDVLASVYATAFDPDHEDFWGYAPSNKATQLTVESAMAAYSLWRLGDEVVSKLTSKQRANMQAWLASCTQVVERKTNHAWFTAMNQAARLKLSKKYSEFHGDESWLIEDLKALDALFIPGNDGWYSDFPDYPVYDYYNFWTFGNFPLFWALMDAGDHPEWAEKFRSRVKLFLQNAPYFFDARGAHPLMGRSLIYRWALLSPLVLGYQEKMWPHSPGLLRRIMRKSLEYHWSLGAYDEKLGKLRETYSADGNRDICEAYIDNGHPYWCMQAFTFLSIPPTDPLWTDPEEPLPVEKDDYVQKIPGPKLLLTGTKSSGQVRWIHAHCALRRDYYRDKYVKLAWSSAFPYNINLNKPNESAPEIPWDQCVVLRKKDGTAATRGISTNAKLLDDGVETVAPVKIGQTSYELTTRIRVIGEFELRQHTVTGPVDEEMEIIEGSYPLGLARDEKFTEAPAGAGKSIAAATGKLAAWGLKGYRTPTVAESFGGPGRTGVNTVHPRMAVLTLATKLEAGKTYTSLWYASPKPMADAEIAAKAREIAASVTG